MIEKFLNLTIVQLNATLPFDPLSRPIREGLEEFFNVLRPFIRPVFK
jgi:hypothetical protein